MTRFILVPVLGIAALAATVPAGAQVPGWLGRSHIAYADRDRRSSYDARREAYDNGYREGLKEGRKDGRKNESFRFEDEKAFQRADKGYHREFGDIQRYRQSFRSGYADGYGEGYRRYSRSGGRYDDSRGRYEDSRGRYEDSRGRYEGPRGRDGDQPRGRYGNGRAVPRDERDAPVYYPRDPIYRDPLPEYRGPEAYGRYDNRAFENGAEDGYEKGVEDVRKGRSLDPLRHAWYRAGDRRYDSRTASREEYRDLYRRGFQEGYERGYREGRYR